MVGENWTNGSPAVRLSLAAPPLLLLAAPAWRLATGSSIPLTAAVACVLAAVAWTGFVAWRVAMNAHRRGGLFDEAR